MFVCWILCAACQNQSDTQKVIELSNNNGKFDEVAQTIVHPLDDTSDTSTGVMFSIDCRNENGCDIVFGQKFVFLDSVLPGCPDSELECYLDMQVEMTKPDGSQQNNNVRMYYNEVVNIGYLDLPAGNYLFNVFPESWSDELSGLEIENHVSATWEPSGTFFCSGVFGSCCPDLESCSTEEYTWACQVDYLLSYNKAFPEAARLVIECQAETGCDLLLSQQLEIPVDLAQACSIPGPSGEIDCEVNLAVDLIEDNENKQTEYITLEGAQKIDITYSSLAKGTYQVVIRPIAWSNIFAYDKATIFTAALLTTF
jgi:hypothetical protein